ncbi:MAG: bifunctional DNA-formamidopyrimidine glycosylase/DNA-(apurinic or apyrimidinic site) lyase [Methyloceanibacter sp.]
MPELPEVETVRLGLAPVLVGNRFASVEQRRGDLRFPLPQHFAQRLAGRRVEALDRRAKYLLARLDDGEVLVMHLGMTGRFSIDRADASHSSPKAPPSPTRLLKGGGGERGGATPPFTFPLEGEVGRSSIGREGGEPPQASNGAKFDASPKALKHEHIVFHLADGVSVRYSDARRFGYMDLIPHEALAGHALFKGLGVEPLSDDFTAEWLAARLKGKATSIKAALVDQRLIAGLGNIYACEGLYRAGVSPFRLAGTLATKTGKPTEKTKALINGVKAVLKEAIRAGGSSLRDYAGADGRLGRFQHSFGVYGREGKPCRTKGCRGTVRRIVQSGRSTFYCPNCQR